jgi:NAD(P)-dependent dehydrogenase (short-subunit alcohol dehydrogenase family)
MNHQGRLKDKVAIVTGAGSSGPGWGNGRANAVLFAREGANVFAVDLRPEAVEDTKEIIQQAGGECISRASDVSKSEEIQAPVRHCIENYGRIDILHNNVGILAVGGPEAISEEVWDLLTSVNLKSMFLTCKYVLPFMVKQGQGAIVNISSIASIRYTGNPSVAYNATQGAVNQLTQNIAVQYAPKGVRARRGGHTLQA